MLSAALFSIATFVVGLCIIAAYADIWLPEPSGPDDTLYTPWSAPHRRESDVIWIATTGAFAASIFAAYAWRSPASVRFHCCFWSGLGLLCLSFAYVRHIMKITTTGGGYDVWIAPLLSAFTIALGLVLLLTAMFLDRVLQNPK
jgi:hypothetical protein